MTRLPDDILKKLDFLKKDNGNRDAVILRYEHCLTTFKAGAFSWRKHALSLLKALTVDASFEVILLSDLPVTVVREKCAAAGLHPHIFGTANSNATGASTDFAMTPEARAEIVRRVSSSAAFRKTLVIGCDDDDLPMLKEGLGIFLANRTVGDSVVQFALSSIKNLKTLLWSLNRAAST